MGLLHFHHPGKPADHNKRSNNGNTRKGRRCAYPPSAYEHGYSLIRFFIKHAAAVWARMPNPAPIKSSIINIKNPDDQNLLRCLYAYQRNQQRKQNVYLFSGCTLNDNKKEKGESSTRFPNISIKFFQSPSTWNPLMDFTIDEKGI